MRKEFVLFAALALGGCVTTMDHRPVTDADRRLAGDVVWGDEADCFRNAESKGMPPTVAMAACGCMKNHVTQNISAATVNHIVRGRAVPDPNVTAAVETDIKFAALEALNVCTR